MKSHDRSHDGRGRHRRAASPEAKKWRELERNLDSVLHLKPTDPRRPKRKKLKPTKPPLRPDWMSEATYNALAEMRSRLEAPSSTPTTMEAP